MSVSSREERILGIIETARAKRPRFKDERITMAHGAGGKATQTLIEGLLAPAFGIDELGDAAAGRRRRADHRLVRGQAAALPGRLDRRAGGQRHGQRPGDGRGAAAGAQPRADPRGGPRRPSVLRAEVEAIAAAAEAAGVRIAAGDTKVVERGHADGMYVCTTGRRRARPARRAVAGRGAARRPDPRLGPDRRARDGDHARARRARPRRRHRVRHALAVAGRRRDPRAGRPLPARRHARRRRLGAQRDRARVRRGDGGRGGGGAGRPRRRRAPRRCSGSTRCTWPTRACSSPSWRRRPRTRRWRALREVDGCERAAEIGEVKTEPPGMVLVNTAFGGRRVMDQLVGDPLPRIC